MQGTGREREGDLIVTEAVYEALMKITVNVDCTPEEARRFFGLPDVQPMQEAVMAELQERLLGGIKQMDPDAMLKNWFLGVPGGIASMEALQKMFWSQFGDTGTKGEKPE